MGIAQEVDSRARMLDDTVEEAEAFMERWRQARFLLIKEFRARATRPGRGC